MCRTPWELKAASFSNASANLSQGARTDAHNWDGLLSVSCVPQQIACAIKCRASLTGSLSRSMERLVLCDFMKGFPDGQPLTLNGKARSKASSQHNNRFSGE
mmetsp:Transcript_17522/g.30663  ORF Transcript_17522/g.30663 Transcript_17522/m.30663 type:complete len:102 (-) Transcript_17522:356-661(-)